MRYIIIFFLAFILLPICKVQAQSVESSISSMEMPVGEQVELTVTAHAQDTAKVEFPHQLLLPANMEVLQANEEPAIDEGNGMKRYRCSYVLTCFEDTLYPIPPVTVRISGKEYNTRQLALQVFTVDVDTTNYEKYYGPKDVQSFPMSWTDDEWSKLFWMAWGVVALLLLLIFLIVRLRSNKPIIARIRFIKRVPPHKKAMKAIEEIKADNVVRAEDPKEYYTRLTDTLRQYIRERFGFNAMEMTTPEIIFHLQESGDQTMIGELKELFETADLVKFAKYSTLMGENDMNLVNAINFIDLTKLEGQPTEERIVPKLTEGEERTRKTRIVIKVLIWTIAVIEAVLFSYILYSIFQLM